MLKQTIKKIKKIRKFATHKFLTKILDSFMKMLHKPIKKLYIEDNFIKFLFLLLFDNFRRLTSSVFA